MFKQIARTATLAALVAAAAFSQAADTRPTVAVLPFTNSAIGQSVSGGNQNSTAVVSGCSAQAQGTSRRPHSLQLTMGPASPWRMRSLPNSAP